MAIKAVVGCLFAWISTQKGIQSALQNSFNAKRPRRINENRFFCAPTIEFLKQLVLTEICQAIAVSAVSSRRNVQRNRRKNLPNAQTHDGPHQPAQVVACHAIDRVQRVAQRTLQRIVSHTVIKHQMPDGKLCSCSTFEPSLLLLAQTLELAPVNDLLIRVVGIPTAKSQIGHDVLELDGNVLS